MTLDSFGFLYPPEKRAGFPKECLIGKIFLNNSFLIRRVFKYFVLILKYLLKFQLSKHWETIKKKKPKAEDLIEKWVKYMTRRFTAEKT